MSGFAHISMEIKLSAYQKAVQNGCGALHQISRAAHKPGLSHLYGAIESMEIRCKRLEQTANSQLRAMVSWRSRSVLWFDFEFTFRVSLSFLTFQGEDHEWVRYWRSVGLNPFSPEQTALTRFTPTAPQHDPKEDRATPTTTPHSLVTLALVHHLGPATPFSDTPVVLPNLLTAEYNQFCDLQSMAHHRACCPKDLFEYPTAITLSDMETMQGTKYYNPLFINPDERKVVQETGNIVKLRSLYSAISVGGREKRQIGLAIAGGSMFGFAVNSVLNFFGYSTTTTEDVKHINANQQHLAQVEKHVELAEEFADQMRREAHNLENKEQMIEKYLQVASALGGIFENYDRMITGLSVLFQHRQLSPLLVERKAVTAEVRSLQHSERVRGNLLLIDPLDVWRCQLSYVVTRSLDIMVVVHIPVAKASSYRQLYQYVRTPLAFDKG